MRYRQLGLVVAVLIVGVVVGYLLSSSSSAAEEALTVERHASKLGWPEYVRDALIQQVLHDRPQPRKSGDGRATFYRVSKGGLYTERNSQLESSTNLYYYSDGCEDKLYVVRTSKESGSVVEASSKFLPSLTKCPIRR